MTLTFLFLAALTVAGTAAALSLRNLVHCLLALTLGLVGLALLYLELGAQFVGFTQVLVYIGAVAILAMFAIMMTRSAEQAETMDHHHPTRFRISGLLIAAAVFAVFAWAILSATHANPANLPQPDASVTQIGVALMHRFVLPLEIIGVLLTAALVGAGILAVDDTRRSR
jgi:NADH-quinone oxidoreductase subunit J